MVEGKRLQHQAQQGKVRAGPLKEALPLRHGLLGPQLSRKAGALPVEGRLGGNG